MKARILAAVLVLGAALVAFKLTSGSESGLRHHDGIARPAVDSAVAPALQGRPGVAGPRMPAGPGGAGDPRTAADPKAETGVDGTVTLWTGRAGAGLEVFLVPWDEPVPPRRRGRTWDFDVRPSPARTARTDEEGHYSLADVPHEGDWVVVARVSLTYEVRSAPLRRQDGRVRRDLAVAAPAELRVRPTSPRGESLRIRQMDLGAEFVWFSLPDEELSEPWALRVEEEGGVVAAQVAPGQHHLDLWLESGPLVTADVDLAPGERRELVVTVPDDGEVRGRVIDPLNRDSVHASITWSGDRAAQGEVGEDGTFRLLGVGRGRGKLSVWVIFRAGGSATVEVDDVEPDGPEIEILLRAAPRLLARVEGLDPEASLTIAVLSAGQTSLRRGPLLDGRLDVAPAVGEPTLLVLGVDGKAPTVVEVPSLSPGEERDLGVLALGAGKDLEGRVCSAVDAPVVGAEVCVAERWSDAQTTTSADGRFVLPRLPVRAFLLRVRAPGFPQHLVEVPGSARGDFKVMLTPGGTVTGVIVDAQGRPAAGGRATVIPARASPYDRDHDATRVSAEADSKGRFSLRLSSGRHVLRGYGPEDLRSEPQEIEIPEGQAIDVSLTLDGATDR